MTRSRHVRIALVSFAACTLGAMPAFAQQMGSDPWRAAPTNRAQVAFSMKQVEDGLHGPGNTTITNTSIVCGGGGTTATGNSNCIILNNATGAISTDQDSDGNQDATTTDKSVTTKNGTQADELMDLLGIN